MRLNLPVLDQLTSCKSLLIAGMGGGFDLFSGLPIYFELLSRGQRAHLASLSFSPHVPRLKTGVRLSPSLVSATAEHQGVVIYFPELYLTHWFRERRGRKCRSGASRTRAHSACSPITASWSSTSPSTGSSWWMAGWTA